MYAEPLSGSPRGDLKVEALKQQKLGQIKLLVEGRRGVELSTPTTQPRACEAGRPCARRRCHPPLHSQKNWDPVMARLLPQMKTQNSAPSPGPL